MVVERLNNWGFENEYVRAQKETQEVKGYGKQVLGVNMENGKRELEAQVMKSGPSLIEAGGEQSSSDGAGGESSERRKGKGWKCKGGRGGKTMEGSVPSIGQKRNGREVNEMGLDEVEMEEMRIFKKVGVDGVSDTVDDKIVADEKVAGPTEWALGGQ